MDITKAYPGLDGIGFIAYVPATNLPAFFAVARSDGMPEFKIFPEGDRPDYFPTVYAEPIEWNEPAVVSTSGLIPCARSVAETPATRAGQH